ncbi:MAG: hypothetical protein HGA71_12655 [Azonexaceae bacterium]|nr:hypothetical protein [Azonexaceae bacterium]
MSSVKNFLAKASASKAAKEVPTSLKEMPAKIVPTAADSLALHDQIGAAMKQGQQQAQANNQQAVQQAVAGARFLVDQFGVTRIAKGPEAIPLDSMRGMDLLRLAVYKATGKAAGDDTLKREIGVVRAKAQASGERTFVHKRTAIGGTGVVIDAGGDRCIRVSSEGWVEGAHDGGTFFVRGPGYGEIPSPVRPASPKDALRVLDTIFERMGVPDIRRLMLAVALVNALRPGVPYVVILLVGGAGSGKTTTAGNLAGFIDPTTSGELPNVPLNAQDVAAVGGEQHVLGADNISKIDPEASDLLCMAANGSEFVVREFNTRKDTARLFVHCQFILTAITNPVTRGDLLDRLLPITLEPHTDYKGEDEVRAWFRKVQPVATGALVELLSAGLARLPEVKRQRKWTHRLVDFCQLGEAIAQACGMEPGTFVEQFNSLRFESAQEAASGDPVIQHVLDVVRDVASKAEAEESFPPWRRWGTTPGFVAIKCGAKVEVAIKASTLRDRVRNRAMGSNGRWIPDSDKQMADVLLQKKPVLAAIGIHVVRHCFNGDSGAAWVFSWSE